MRDLRDGESVEVQGSAARPYVLKNIGGVYSCSCPAWRNQSLGIEQRTCKHLRALRGDAAESARVGTVAINPSRSKSTVPPPLLLAETWHPGIDPTGWLVSEKLDGVRAYWTGQEFQSRNGHPYRAPDWFTSGLPDVPLDGELWLGRKQFQRTVGIVRRHDGQEQWRQLRFVVFDAPAQPGVFEERLAYLQRQFRYSSPPHADVLDHQRCAGADHLDQEFGRITALGGEGLMLRQPGSGYAVGRSPPLLKVKPVHEAEARVIGHEPGTGRHRGRLGALLVELPSGKVFAVGSGLSDAQRSQPPALGHLVTFRNQEWTDGGLPRFPVFVRVRDDDSPLHPQQGIPMASTLSSKRRFEFVGGRSNKFWEITVDGPAVSVHYGRNGTTGQTTSQSFPDAASAQNHADRLIRAKLAKGYVAIG